YEPTFTRREALRTAAFWMLSLYTVLVYPVQAGVSLHQAPHLIERGIEPTAAALMISSFSLASAISGFAFGLTARRNSVQLSLSLSAAALLAGATLMIWVSTNYQGYAAAILFGFGVGGIITILPIAWADFFGRRSFGAIRGIALSIQVIAQAVGPILSGVLRDLGGDYVLSLLIFAGMAGAAMVAAWFLMVPRRSPDLGSSA
ncbi:MAG: MFS transporter, partial [Hyphomicrobiaceae bacterium]